MNLRQFVKKQSFMKLEVSSQSLRQPCVIFHNPLWWDTLVLREALKAEDHHLSGIWQHLLNTIAATVRTYLDAIPSVCKSRTNQTVTTRA
jgi:hypothetical protein